MSETLREYSRTMLVRLFYLFRIMEHVAHSPARERPADELLLEELSNYGNALWS